MTNLIRHKTRQLQSLKTVDYCNDFLVRAAKGQIAPAELRITKVEARLNSLPIHQMNEGSIVLAFTKVITDVFQYFNTDWNDSIVSMLISDLLDEYRNYSVLEIYKAIHEGRKRQTDLYGKLSGRHFTTWINEYLAQMGDDISKFRQNEKYEMQNALDDLHIPNAEFTVGSQSQKKSDSTDEAKQEFTNKDKIRAYKAVTQISEAERLRREHSYAWSLEKHGDYEAYMKAFKPPKKT